MATRALVEVEKAVPGPKPGRGASTEQITSLKSQVTTAFGELSRVQNEIGERFDLFSKRQAELDRRQADLDKACEEHKGRVAAIERREQQSEARDTAVTTREDAVDRREQAARSFQALQVRLAAAVEDPTPTKLAEAMEAANTSVGDGHVAQRACSADDQAVAAGEGAGQAVDEPTFGAVVAQLSGDLGIDLGDFSETELSRFVVLQQLGSAPTDEIAEQIRRERSGTQAKRKSWFS